MESRSENKRKERSTRRTPKDAVTAGATRIRSPLSLLWLRDFLTHISAVVVVIAVDGILQRSLLLLRIWPEGELDTWIQQTTKILSYVLDFTFAALAIILIFFAAIQLLR